MTVTIEKVPDRLMYRILVSFDDAIVSAEADFRRDTSADKIDSPLDLYNNIERVIRDGTATGETRWQMAKPDIQEAIVRMGIRYGEVPPRRRAQ